jgi:uncharacterized delta-60 repeat protein
MASYIELDKQSSFTSSSNVGKVLFGVNSSGSVVITDNNGVSKIISSTLPYSEYASKISRIGIDSPKTSYLLSNTLDISPIWTRVSSGNFRFKFDKQIDVDKLISNVPIISEAGTFSYNITNELNTTNSFKLGFNNIVTSIAIQSDGKILFGGEFTSYNGTSSDRIIRLNSDGSIDTDFVVGTGFNNYVTFISIQSDGKILVGGEFTTYNETGSNRIIRLNSDGSIDTDFVVGTGFNSVVRYISIQSGGRILVGGQFTTYDEIGSNYIIRLNSDGSIDNGFSIGDGFNDYVYSIVTQSDGKILVCGNFSEYNGTGSNYIVRLNSDGSIDTDFVVGTGFNGTVNYIKIQSDDKIIVGGGFTTYNETGSNYIIRLNSDGSIDNTFSIGTGFDGTVNCITIQSDGKILVSGGFTSYNGTTSDRMIRLNSTGIVDNTFSTGTGFDNGITSFLIQSDGNILVGGYFTTYNGATSNYMIRLNSNGSYGFIDGFDERVSSIAIQSDGNILMGGEFTTYNGTSSNHIIRLNSDGGVDNTFLSIGASGFDNGVYSIVIQSDGNILVGGNFTTYNGTSSNRIIRLNSDGSVDNTFSIGTGFDGSVNCITTQSDGKILVGGVFTDYNGTGSNYIVRLNSDGSIDNTFSIGSGFNSTVNYIKIQSDGKILVGGEFTAYNGTGSAYIIRLNSDGSIDTGFSIGTGFNDYVYSIAIQSDGKILVGGLFNNYNGTSSVYIIRLNSDGSIDNTFSIGTGFDGVVYSIVVQSDSKILVGGAFNTYNGTNSNYIIRLNSDGSVQYGFDDTFLNTNVSTIAIQSDGNVLVGGYFNNTDNVNYITKFDNEFFYNLNGDDTFENQPIEIKIYN